MTRLRILSWCDQSACTPRAGLNQIAEQGSGPPRLFGPRRPVHPNFKKVTTYSYATRSGGGAGREIRACAVAVARGRRAGENVGGAPPRTVVFARRVAVADHPLAQAGIGSLAGVSTGRLPDARGALTLRGALPRLGGAPGCGRDIYLYGPLAGHTEKIKGILAGCDYYTCECHRDVELAREYGFEKTVLPVLPIAGGFHLDRLRQYRQPGPISARRVIALKGYQHWAGRALVGLRAIELCADQIKAGGYGVAVYLAEPDVRIAAERMALRTGIPVEVVPPSSHEDILRLHGRSRVSVGLSISDGLSTSALEALLMGSFPVQSDTCCLTELLKDGEGALIVPPEDSSAVAAAIRRALSDDALVDRAATLNERMAIERLDYRVVQTQVIDMYERIAAETRGRGVP